MNTAKIYYDSDGNECSIVQMVKREPQWSANRIQEGEKAIEENKTIRTATLDEVRPEVERLLTDETVIANCINLETLNKAIDNLRGNDE